MRFDLVSDVHEDTGWRGRPLRTGTSETLVIAGDVGNGVEVTAAAVTALAREYGQVVFVDGNHEFYSSGGEIDRRGIGSRKRSPRMSTISTGKGPFCLGNTAFAGANGWYQFHEPSSVRFGRNRSGGAGAPTTRGSSSRGATRSRRWNSGKNRDAPCSANSNAPATIQRSSMSSS